VGRQGREPVWQGGRGRERLIGDGYSMAPLLGGREMVTMEQYGRCWQRLMGHKAAWYTSGAQGGVGLTRGRSEAVVIGEGLIAEERPGGLVLWGSSLGHRWSVATLDDGGA
jgi:hypothetical protein